MKNYSEKDLYWMKRALELSWFFKGTTSPNPTVGAIVVSKNGELISTGVTQPYGEFHAERMALKDLSLSQTQGATLYVTLEPCCFKGRTPACTDIILEKKIKRVVIATDDPNPHVNGGGIELLKENGIDVIFGVLQEKANEINQDFFHSQIHKKPFVFLKYASTLDGFMAPLKQTNRYIITNSRADKFVHLLRFRSDALLVGVNTIIQDDPLLTIRFSLKAKELLRIVLDSDLQIPLGSRVLIDENKTLLVISKKSFQEKTDLIKTIMSRKNKEIFVQEKTGDLHSLLDYLYEKKDILSLMVEGGAGVFGSFFEQKLVNKIFIFYGNQFLGKGLSPFGNISLKKGSLAELVLKKVKKIENNFLTYGNIKWQ